LYANNRLKFEHLPAPSAGITQIRLYGYDLRLENEPPHLKDVLFIYQKIKPIKRKLLLEFSEFFFPYVSQKPKVGRNLDS
jgi:hypothetical protein